ncbi:MAG TPA: hypothetical protein VK485_11000 [Sphingomicrobium sp.]|nr:hypothetical protein [Sphingomicrobium sp.]
MRMLLLLAGATALASTFPVLAKPGNGHGNSQAAKGHKGNYGYVGYGAGGCPPGLAKKNNGCLPPGQAKKLFARGQRVPYGYDGLMRYDRLPYDLRNRYDLDRNDRYIYRDGYLYQVDRRTSIVERILSAIL